MNIKGGHVACSIPRCGEIFFKFGHDLSKHIYLKGFDNGKEAPFPNDRIKLEKWANHRHAVKKLNIKLTDSRSAEEIVETIKEIDDFPYLEL